MSQAVYKIYDLACEHFSNPSEELYRVIYDLEADIDKMVDKMRASNSKRLSKMKCEAVQGLYFNEILRGLGACGGSLIKYRAGSEKNMKFMMKMKIYKDV